MECGRYICPKDMVPTPVGYKCPICAKPAPSQYILVKPKQAAGAAVLAILAAYGGGLLLIVMPIHFLFITAAWGALVGEAARRGSGGHRGPIIAGIAGVAVVAVGLLLGFWLLDIVLGVIGVMLVTGWGWGR